MAKWRGTCRLGGSGFEPQLVQWHVFKVATLVCISPQERYHAEMYGITWRNVRVVDGESLLNSWIKSPAGSNPASSDDYCLNSVHYDNSGEVSG